MALSVAGPRLGGAESRLRMQAAYDAWHAARTVDVSKIKRLEMA
jgi:hypothetical protein